MTRREGPLVPTAFPRNPAYGSGIFRRRIRLLRQEGAVLALVDDTNHAMWARVHHDGAHVTAVEGRTVRAPNSNCPGAAVALQELVGLPLTISRSDLFGGGRPFRNCTHLFDAAALAIEQAQRGKEARTYDIVIPDETNSPVVAQVLRDGETLLQWRMSKGMVTEFAPAPPVPIMRGFTGWAVATLLGEQLDAAFLLQRAYLVSGARQFIVDQSPGLPITAMPELFGACYAYQPDRLTSGFQNVSYVLDLTKGFGEDTLQPLP